MIIIKFHNPLTSTIEENQLKTNAASYRRLFLLRHFDFLFTLASLYFRESYMLNVQKKVRF